MLNGLRPRFIKKISSQTMVTGRVPESANFLGFNVGNQFLGDAIANQFVTLEHTLIDAASLTSPVMLVSAEKDAWVAPDDFRRFGTHWVHV